MTPINRRGFSRREFIVAISSLAVVGGIAEPVIKLKKAEANQMFTLPNLPYSVDALAPIIDAETMTIHHTKHHQAYIDKLNEQVGKIPELGSMSLEQIMAAISKYPTAVRNNGGGHFNHSLFWQLMAPEGKGGAPSKELSDRIAADIGGPEKLKEGLNTGGLNQFGSGWSWLIVTPDKKLAITSTPNQDNPLMDVVEKKGTPIIGIDVWEHAYYLTYRNRRADYLKSWWSVLNWNEVNARFVAAMK